MALASHPHTVSPLHATATVVAAIDPLGDNEPVLRWLLGSLDPANVVTLVCARPGDYPEPVMPAVIGGSEMGLAIVHAQRAAWIEQSRHIDHRLDEIRRRLAAQGLRTQVRTVVHKTSVFGRRQRMHIASALAAVTDELGADLVVVGESRPGACALGDMIALRTNCEVLVIPCHRARATVPSTERACDHREPVTAQAAVGPGSGFRDFDELWVDLGGSE